MLPVKKKYASQDVTHPDYETCDCDRALGRLGRNQCHIRSHDDLKWRAERGQLTSKQCAWRVLTLVLMFRTAWHALAKETRRADRTDKKLSVLAW